MLYFTADLGSSDAAQPISEPILDSGQDINSEERTENSSTQSSVDQLGSGPALLKSDGTSEGTRLLKEFQSINDLVEVNGELYFIANDGTGNRLWKSDGTTRGTELVKDLYPGADPNYPQDLFEIDGVLFYSAIDGTGDDGKYPYVNGYEVWRREGNEVGSRFFRNLIPDRIISETEISEEEEEVLALDPNGNPIPLTKTTITTVSISGETTTTTTEVIEQIYISGVIGTNRSETTARADKSDEDIEGTTTSTETTFATTKRITYIAEITTSPFENDSFPKSFVGINGNYFFAAHSSAFYSLETRTADTLIGGLELWHSDGTESGTQPININQNNYTFYGPEDGKYTPAEIIEEPGFGFKQQSSSSFPRELTKFENNLVLVANDGISGFELWTVNEQGENLRQIADISEGSTSSSPEELTVVGNRLYFTANDKSTRKLWSIRNTLGEPTLVTGAGEDPKHLTNIDGKLYFSAKSELGRELWVADNNKASLVADINPGIGSSSPKDFNVVNHWVNQTIKPRLYFSAEDGERGVELWSLDLSSNDSEPQREADIYSGPFSSDPRLLTNVEQNLYLTANDGEKGRELWALGVTIIGPNGKIAPDIFNIKTIENETHVDQFLSDTAASWSLNGGVDETFFQIQSNGTLSFSEAPAYEIPKDLNRDNIYEVVIRAKDLSTGVTTDQKLNVEIVDDINIEKPGEGEEISSDIQTEEKQINVYRFNTPDNTEWSLSGDDAQLFTINSTGSLRFINAPIYDQPRDIDKNNIYEISVSASNPTSGSSDTQDIAIEVVYVVDIQGPSGEPGAEQSKTKIDNTDNFVFQFTSSKDASWELEKGADSDLFTIQSNGALSFNQIPDYYNPLDANRDNIYEVVIGGRNPSKGNVSYQSVDIEVIYAVDIEGPSGQPGADYDSIEVEEREKYVYQFTSQDKAKWEIVNGADAELFEIKKDGSLQFKQATDYDNPQDTDKDNVYEVIIGARNPQENNLSQQDVEVEVVYVVDIQGPSGEPGADKSSIEIQENNKFVFEFTSEKNSNWELAGGADQALFNLNSNGKLRFKKAPDFENPIDTNKDNIYKVTVGAKNPNAGNLSKQTVKVKVTDEYETTATTNLVKDIYKGTKGSNPSSLIQFNNDLYFAAKNSGKGVELWKSQGSKTTTSLLKDINPGKSSSTPSGFTIFDKKIYFSADNGNTGVELWRTDGTKKGTEQVANLSSGPRSSSPSDLAVLDNKLVFGADDGNDGPELWGLAKGSNNPKLIRNINPNIGSAPQGLTKLKGKIYFSAEGEIYGRELWETDGTKKGTKLVFDINPGGFHSNPLDLTIYNKKLYFTAETYTVGRQLWSSDGSRGGTSSMSSLAKNERFSNPRELSANNEYLFFTADTSIVATNKQTTKSRIQPLSQERNVENINNYNDVMDSYKETGDCFYLEVARSWALWELEDESNTALALDWNTYAQECNYTPIVIPSPEPEPTPQPTPEPRTEYLGNELWRSNGNTSGTTLVLDINPGSASSNPTALTSIDNRLYFSADNGIHGEELWMSDGTQEGTIRLTDINKGAKNSSPRDISEGPDGIYFSAIRDKVGRELWRLDDDKQNATRIVHAGKGKKNLRALDDSNDEFRFELANQFGKAKADRITGFSSDNGDQLALSTTAFPGLSQINLVTVSSKRQLKAQQIQPSNFTYYEAKGKLYFDQNGPEKGFGDEGGLFAILKGGPDLTESNFLII